PIEGEGDVDLVRIDGDPAGNQRHLVEAVGPPRPLRPAQLQLHRRSLPEADRGAPLPAHHLVCAKLMEHHILRSDPERAPGGSCLPRGPLPAGSYGLPTASAPSAAAKPWRSEERRVGKECRAGGAEVQRK